MKEILERLKPLVKSATELHPVAFDTIPKQTYLHSHFGGTAPYAHAGNKWPFTKSKKPMSFIFQLERKEAYHWPKHIAMLQFFYNFEEGALESKDDGWLVKTYSTVADENYTPLQVPEGVDQVKFALVKNSEHMSLPNIEGIIMTDPKVFHLCGMKGLDRLWATYNEACEKTLGNTYTCSQMGGYPQWIQEDKTPLNSAGEPLVFLMQIASEEAAGFQWGNDGMIYIFYNRETKEFKFILQAY